MNARYQKHTSPKGQTRKSSAAAKPSRKEGSGAAAKAKTKTLSKDQRPGGKYYIPDTPEYKYWSRIWWYCLGAGFFLALGSAALQLWLKVTGPLRTVSVIMMMVAYGFIIASLVIDWTRMRPMRAGTYKSKAEKAKAAEKKPADNDDTADTDGDEDE
jgi:hypothetical protein